MLWFHPEQARSSLSALPYTVKATRHLKRGPDEIEATPGKLLQCGSEVTHAGCSRRK